LIFMDFAGSMIDAVFGATYTLAPGVEYTTTYSGLFRLLISGAFGVGVATYIIRLFRHQETRLSNLFAGFEQFGKAFVLGLLITIFTLLWALLFIVPGIIAIFRYSQAYFIMQDHPELSAMDCIRESIRLMDGNKAKLFSTTISFIGWALLSMLPVIIYAIWLVSSILSAFLLSGSTSMPIYNLGPMEAILAFVLSMGYSAVLAYYYATRAAFYELLTGHMSGQVFALEDTNA
jgi:uncharacterized membrane protein